MKLSWKIKECKWGTNALPYILSNFISALKQNKFGISLISRWDCQEINIVIYQHSNKKNIYMCSDDNSTWYRARFYKSKDDYSA